MTFFISVSERRDAMPSSGGKSGCQCTSLLS
jgi:hypothetical protein